MKKPNILFAIADDASHFGAYGHSFVRTPACNAVAQKGALFANAFSPNPKCAPSRASILTGRFPWQNREGCNHFGYFPSGFQLFPDLLEKAGYYNGCTGKGWGPGNYTRAGYTRNPAGPEYKERYLVPPEGSAINKCDYAANFEDFLNAKETDHPFYFWYGGYEPHRKYEFGEGLKHGKKIEDIKEIPSYWPDDEKVKIDMLDYAFEIEWFDSHLAKMLDILEKHGELENTFIIATSDNGCPFPRVKGQMYEQDFHLPMMARWDGVIKPGTTVSDLVNFVDIAPTILEAAGIPAPSEMTGISFLGLLKGQKQQGRDYTYFGREKHDVGRENDLGYPVRCIRNKKYLYIHNFAPERWPAGNPETGFTNCDSSPTKTLILDLNEKGVTRYFDLSFGKRPMEELYDIETDPECINNLAMDSRHAAAKAELWDKLQAKLKETEDPRINGSGDIFETYEYVGNSKHSWANYVNGTFVKQSF
ncbi:MAG: sulfatase [Treponema sp.]|nr:sulfatase [Treponema sp.]